MLNENSLFRVSAALLAAVITVPSLSAYAQQAHTANYALAARWTSAKINKLLFDIAVTPHWLEHSDRFWYSYETSAGRKFWLVDPKAKSRKPLFDNAKMAAQLTKISLFPYDSQHLPIRTIKFIENDSAIEFSIDYPKDAAVREGDQVKTVKDVDSERLDGTTQQKNGKTAATPAKTDGPTRTLYFRYDLAAETLSLDTKYTPPTHKPSWATVSPDGKTVVFARGYNLYMMDAASYELAKKKADDPAIKEVQLTSDGEEYYSYGIHLREDGKKQYQDLEKNRTDFRIPAVYVVWSKDSRHFVLERNDQRKVKELWVINSLAEPRPTLETYKYEMPGEANVDQSELYAFDVASHAKMKIKADKFKDQGLSILTRDVTMKESQAAEDGVPPQWMAENTILFTRVSRDRHKLDVCSADPATGEVKPLIEERLNTYIDTMPIKLINGGKQLLFWSERDGWGHWYLYDISGKLINQVTHGEFMAQQIVGVDEKSHVVFFDACGLEPGEDPYYTHLYRVNLDGKNQKLLAPGNALHTISMDDDHKYFVDNFSRVDEAPASTLRDASGNELIALETTDLSALTTAGYKLPEPFSVKADDGITDLYGVMYKPFDFDPHKKYPLIEYVYPGPQTEAVSKGFAARNANTTLAQLGFIVIEIGNRGGNPQRSKWYHNYGYGNLRDYGLADKKRAAEELGQKYPWIDMDRVGIYGHSGGGFMSAAAMLVYPDFFKVAWSESGNHENNIYNRWWSETHHGVKEVADKDGAVHFEYNIDKNSEIAKNLKGHLMLTTGDIDDNVHPGNTYRLMNALIRANKRFDCFIYPGQRHGYGDMGEYCFWQRCDYFAKYLLGDFNQPVDILEMDRERPATGRK
jgi:dipeptidyl-peptidase 4